MARDFVLISAIWFFFTGFEFRAYYFGNLHIPLGSLSVVDNEVLIGSYSVFLAHWPYVLAISLAAIAAITVIAPQRLSAQGVKAFRALALLLLVISFPVLNVWAHKTANDLFNDFVNRPRPNKPLIVSLDKEPWDPSLIDSSIIVAMKAGCVELITESSDNLYALVRQNGHSPWIYVAALPKRAIRSWIVPLAYPKGTYAERCLPV